MAYFQCLFKCEILSTLFGHTVLYQDAISYEHHRRCCSWYCVIEKIIKWSVLPPLATIFSSIFVRHHRIQSWQSICTLAVLRHQTVIFSILTFAASQATSAKKNIGGINIVLLHEWNITLLLSLSKVIYLLAFSIGSFFLFPRKKKLYVVRTTIKVVYKWWNIAMRRQSHLFCRLALSPSESEVIQNLALRSNGRLGLSKLLPTSHFYFQNAATCGLATSSARHRNNVSLSSWVQPSFIPIMRLCVSPFCL